jgi:hypothetical protein
MRDKNKTIKILNSSKKIPSKKPSITLLINRIIYLKKPSKTNINKFKIHKKNFITLGQKKHP